MPIPDTICFAGSEEKNAPPLFFFFLFPFFSRPTIIVKNLIMVTAVNIIEYDYQTRTAWRFLAGGIWDRMINANPYTITV